MQCAIRFCFPKSPSVIRNTLPDDSICYMEIIICIYTLYTHTDTHTVLFPNSKLLFVMCAYVMAILMNWFENCRINHWFHRISFVIINFITIQLIYTYSHTHTLKLIHLHSTHINIYTYTLKRIQENYKRKLINPIFLFSRLFFSLFLFFFHSHFFRFASSRLLIYNKKTYTQTHMIIHIS